MQNKENLIWPREDSTERPVQKFGAVSAHMITGWSLHCAVQAPVQRLSMGSCSSVQLAAGSGIPRGGGQSFGDASLPNRGVSLVLDPVSENTHSSIDKKTGVLICPASMTQQQVLQRIVPMGWVLPVIPGASGITIGGAVAADAHGKNHYTQGSIADHLISLKMLLASGEVVCASRSEYADLFWATIGGLGLTGLIVEVMMQLRPLASTRVSQTVTPFKGVPEMLDIIEAQKETCEYLLGTVDGNFGNNHRWHGVITTATTCQTGTNKCLGSYPHRRNISVPRFVSDYSFSNLSTWALNHAVRFSTRFRRSGKTDLDRFFFPQDALANWNRLFGKAGFVDYQCCVPIENSLSFLMALQQILNENSSKCFLVAVKRFRKPCNQNPLVFAQEGISIALDMPWHRHTATQLDALDDLVISFSGRVNLIKDARLSPERFSQMYPRRKEWLAVKRKFDPDDRFRSQLSVRLGLDFG